MLSKSLALFLAVVLILGSLWLFQDNTRQSNTAQTPAEPSISYLDILNHPEFEVGVINALRENNQNEIKRLQARAVEIGILANLSVDEMSLLQGDRGLKFIQFNAKRKMFMDDFSYLYNQLLPIDKLKESYPEAADLFARADKLIAQRDQNILQTAKQLAGTEDYQLYLLQARQQWKDTAAKQALTTPNP